jgi:hypothetical protein
MNMMNLSPAIRSWALAVIVLPFAWQATAEETRGAPAKDPETQRMVRTWNGECIACHTAQALLYPPRADLDLEKLADALVDPFKFQDSDHAGMACKTCHGKGYVDYPHVPSKEDKALECAECHAQVAFRVQAQFDQSVHARNLTAHFGCNTCHNPHVDRVARAVADPRQTVALDNGKCMACHNSDEKFAEYGGLIPQGKSRPDIDAIHAFLPNTQRHWQAVRCVECHTPASTHTKLDLSHEILDKERAQRDCVTCHSQDTELSARLYRYTQTEANELGFVNSALLGDAYVIGATRNVYIDRVAVWLIVLTLAGIAVHGVIRILAGIFRRRR